MASGRIEFAERLIELWNAEKYDEFLDELGPELEFTPDPSFPDAGVYSGEELRRWIGEWVSTWGENRFEMHSIEEIGHAFLIRGRWHLATRQSGGEVPLADFSIVSLFADDEAERPSRMAVFFNEEEALALARGTG
jgi:hypothetical protein